MPSTREAIAELQTAGLKQPEIARQLDLAPTTVSYHIERLLRGDEKDPVTEPPPPDVELRSNTRLKVAQMLAEDVPRVEIARRLGVSKATVSYHARRLGQTMDSRFSKRYDWNAVQHYYDDGHGVRDCIKAFGFSSASWSDAVNRGAIVARPSATPMPELLVAGTYRGRNNLKIRLVKEGLKEGCCEHCGLFHWRGARITLSLHHINGDRLDNRLENLELLCPNCHSQTSNYSGRNGHRRGTSSGGGGPAS